MTTPEETTTTNPFFDGFTPPEWLKHAYFNDATVNRVIKEWRLSSKPVSVLYETLAMKLYEAKNYWEATAIDAKNRTPHIFVVNPSTTEQS